jgi:cell division protein FtsB
MWFKGILCILLIVNVLLVWAIVGGRHGLRPYRQQQDILSQVQSRLEQVREDNIELSRKIRLLQKDDGYIKQMVRTRLHYVHTNEIMYLPEKVQPSAQNAK